MLKILHEKNKETYIIFFAICIERSKMLDINPIIIFREGEALSRILLLRNKWMYNIDVCHYLWKKVIAKKCYQWIK